MLIRLLADGMLVFIVIASVVAGVYWLVGSKPKPKLAVIVPYVIMAGLSSLLFAKFMSLLPIQTERPYITQGVEAGATYIDNPGFPSDHALLATVMVVAIYFMTPYRKTAYLLMGATVIMSVARVVALVHTPLDVVGGIVLGFVGVFWYIKHKQDIIARS